MTARRRPVLLLLAAISAGAPNAGAESFDSPRVIETLPLKLIGDGAAPAPPVAPPSQGAIAIATPPLRLIGAGAPGAPERTPPQGVIIETRPLKLVGAKP
jgi:hypothetical protein